MTAHDKFLNSVSSAHALADDDLDTVAGGTAGSNQLTAGTRVRISCDTSLACPTCRQAYHNSYATVLGRHTQNIYQVEVDCCVQSGALFRADQLIIV